MNQKEKLCRWIGSYTIRDKVVLFVTALVLALFMSIGDFFQERSLLTIICRHNKILGILAMYLIYVIVFLLLSVITDGLIQKYNKTNKKESVGVFSKKSWIGFRGLLLVAWMPYIISYYPGSISHDGMAQVNIAAGVWPLSNAHPIISTWYMGIFIRIGKLIGNDYLGILLYVLVQSVIMACILVYMLKFVYDITHSKVIVWGSIAFFALYPTWGMMVESVIKDTLYTAFFILFTVMFAKTVLYKEEKLQDKLFLFGFVLSMLGMCFWRNNGIYVVIISFVVLLVSRTMKNYKKPIALVFFSVLIVYYGMNNYVYPMLNVAPGSTREMLSLPFQQTARYLKEHPEDVSDSEKKAISAVLDFDRLPELYNPNIADYARNTFNERSTNDDLKEYFKVWLEMFFKHPSTYFAATFNNTYNYYYFKDMRNFMSEYQNYTKWELNKSLDIEEGGNAFSNKCKDVLEKYVELVNKIPVINHFGRCGIFTWCLCIAFAMLLRRREYAKMMLCVPLMCSVLICIASPVNGLQRYMWCVMGTVMIPLAVLLDRNKNDN